MQHSPLPILCRPLKETYKVYLADFQTGNIPLKLLAMIGFYIVQNDPHPH